MVYNYYPNFQFQPCQDRELISGKDPKIEDKKAGESTETEKSTEQL